MSIDSGSFRYGIEPAHESAIKRALTNKLNLSAFGVFVVFLVCVAYIVSNVLGTPLTTRAKDVRVELPSTGGLFEGSAVTYRGVNAGRITKISFTATGVQATAHLTTKAKIPSRTRAVVRSLSPVGEQYLDFQPLVDHGPWLADGSRISASYTDVPETLASTVIAVNKLLDQIDPAQLQTVLDETSKALVGTGDELGRLTDQSNLLVEDLNRYWPNLDRLLTSSGTLLDIGTDNAARLRKMATDFKAFATFLKGYNPELEATLKDAPGEVDQLRGVLRDAEQTLPLFLDLGSQMTHLLASYEPHLRVLLAAFAPGLGVLGKAVRNGSLQLNAIGQDDHDCVYSTSERSPTNPTRRPIQTDGSCPASHSYLQRGAAHAPGPVA
jgi:virulence factor Mce-like protein